MSTAQEFTDFVDALGAAMNNFRASIRQRFKDGDLDLTVEMLQVLRYLWKHDGVNQQEIANAVNKDKAALTALIDNLARRELVTRHEDSDDRRNKRITLTTQGWSLQQRVTPMLAEVYDAAGKNLPIGHLRESITLLEQITKNLERGKG